MVATSMEQAISQSGQGRPRLILRPSAKYMALYSQWEISYSIMLSNTALYIYLSRPDSFWYEDKYSDLNTGVTRAFLNKLLVLWVIKLFFFIPSLSSWETLRTWRPPYFRLSTGIQKYLLKIYSSLHKIKVSQVP